LIPSPSRAGLEVTHLLDDPIRVCLAPGEHPDPFPLAALHERAFAAGRSGSMCHRLTRVLCELAGFAPDVVYETDDVAFTAAPIEAGAAVAVMPELLIATAPVPIVTRAPDPPAGPRRIFAVHRASAAGLASVRAGLAALRASTASTSSPEPSDGRPV